MTFPLSRTSPPVQFPPPSPYLSMKAVQTRDASAKEPTGTTALRRGGMSPL